MFLFITRSFSVSILVALFWTHSAELQAQPAIDEIVVTSNRIPIPARQLGTSVSMLDFEEIQSRGALALSDVMRQMPAVAASSNGGLGNATTLRIRGEEGFRTLTYLDGMRLQDPSAPQIATDFSNLISSGIGRVEILRGPQGLAYGADAGGVINLSTRSSSEPFELNLEAQGGKFGTQQMSGSLMGSNESLDYFLSVADFGTDGFNNRPSDVIADEDGYENQTFHGRLGYLLSDTWRLDLVHREVDGSNDYDGCFGSLGPTGDCSSDYGMQASRLGLEFLGAAFSHQLSFMRTSTDRQDFTASAPTFGSQGEQTRGEYIGSATALDGVDLIWGFDYQKDEANGLGRKNQGAFIELLSDFSHAFFLTAGMRYDDNEDFGTNTSFRLSTAYLFETEPGTLKFKAALGSGFRAPSPYEIQYNRGPYAFAPATEGPIVQEESKGWEVGAQFNTKELHLEAIVFDQSVSNAIYFDLLNYSGYLQDKGRSASSGIELIADYGITDALRVSGNYTYNTTERPDGSQRLRRPNHLFNFGLRLAGFNNRITMNAFYRSQADAIDVGDIALEDFGVLDFTATFQINESLRVYGRIENALDEDYMEISDYNTAGLAAFVGISLKVSAL
ncbi:MAG TPA: TonB-dependent receptor [Gammaproteobacteria bacterium]|nr:TonB-dependent receptor [Gammaproteobacteria bacterium]